MALAAVVIVGVAPVTVPPPAPTPRPSDLGADLVRDPKLPSLGYGVHAFLWWNETTRARDLEFIRMMRFGYVKQIFGWKDIQPDPALPESWTHADAVMDEADYRGIKVVARLGKPPDWAIRQGTPAPGQPPFDEGAFGKFCGDLAARYKGRIVAYQVWNEPNLHREWLFHPPDAAAYVKVLAACNAAIKAADPAAVVITAGLAPTGTHSPQATPDDIYLLQMYAAGAANHYDVLGVNAPGLHLPPEAPPDDPRTDGQRWQVFRRVEDMRAIMVAQGEGHKQVAILETGWTTDTRETIPGPDGTPIPNPYRWHAVSEADQARYLVAAYEYAGKHWRPWLSLMICIYLADPAWTPDNEEYWWALNDAGFNTRLRPAFIDLANSARYLDDRVIPAIDPSSNPYTPMPPRP
jgi:hypothetical protein